MPGTFSRKGPGKFQLSLECCRQSAKPFLLNHSAQYDNAMQIEFGDCLFTDMRR